MPNDDARIICGSARTLQVRVLIVNGGVRFLHNSGHFIVTQKANGQSENLNALISVPSPKLLTKREARCYYCQRVTYLETIGASPNNAI